MHRTHRREFPRARTDALRGWNRALVSATWRGLTCPFRVRACVRIWTHAGSYDFSHIDAWRMRGRVGWRVRVARGFTGLVTSTSFQTLLDAVFFFFFLWFSSAIPRLTHVPSFRHCAALSFPDMHPSVVRLPPFISIVWTIQGFKMLPIGSVKYLWRNFGQNQTLVARWEVAVTSPSL